MNAAVVPMTVMRMQPVQKFLASLIAVVTGVSLEMGARVQVSSLFTLPCASLYIVLFFW